MVTASATAAAMVSNQASCVAASQCNRRQASGTLLGSPRRFGRLSAPTCAEDPCDPPVCTPSTRACEEQELDKFMAAVAESVDAFVSESKSPGTAFAIRRAAEEAEAEELRRIAEEEEAWERSDSLTKAIPWCESNGYQDVNSSKKTFWGVTKFPLHTAVKHGRADIVQLLLKCGADKNLRDSKGRLPRDLTKDLAGIGTQEFVLELLS